MHVEKPWPIRPKQDCEFYHTIDLPTETVFGHWDIRGRFADYIGRYPLAGKTVLDLGTATGFLAFSAEAAGAEVTAMEARHAGEFYRVPFRGHPFHADRALWTEGYQSGTLIPMKNAYWYARHALGSRVATVYAPVDDLHFTDRRFDVVIAGALVEHLSDPVSAIGAMARVAKEAVILAFTEVWEEQTPAMRVLNGWSDPVNDFSWWMLSRGLYERLFGNLGFDIETVSCSAIHYPQAYNNLTQPTEYSRPTLIARRR